MGKSEGGKGREIEEVKDNFGNWGKTEVEVEVEVESRGIEEVDDDGDGDDVM